MTELKLLKGVNLDPNYETSIDFENTTKQLEYFNTFESLPWDTQYDYSYIRGGNPIVVEYSYEEMESVNYCIYTNDVGKTYFNFIKNKEYVNPNCTRIDIECDVLQTYMFDYELGECFVEREHQDRFIRGETTINCIRSFTDENIEAGSDYVLVNKDNLLPNNYVYNDEPDNPVNLAYLIVWSNSKLHTDTSPLNSDLHTPKHFSLLNGMVGSKYVYMIPFYSGDRFGYIPNITIEAFDDTKHLIFDSAVSGQILNTITAIRELNEITAIQVSRYPIIPIAWREFSSGVYQLKPSDNTIGAIVQLKDTYGSGYAIYIMEQDVGDGNVSYNKPMIYASTPNNITIGTPKSIINEPKLVNYPYHFYKVRYGDNVVDIKPQYFNSDNVNINYFKSISENSTTIFMPRHYRGLSVDVDTSVVSINDNELPLTTDAYKNYMTQNKAQFRSGLITGLVTTAVSAGVGISTGGVGLAIGASAGLSAFNQIASSVAKVSDLKATPDTTRKTGDDYGISMLKGKLYATLEEYSVDDTGRQRVFNYLYMKGYTTNTYKTPNLKSRYYFNFIKLNDVVLKVNKLPLDVASQIKAIYIDGVTLWHYRDATTFNYLNYDLENWEINLLGGEN